MRQVICTGVGVDPVVSSHPSEPERIEFTPRPDVVPCFTPHVRIATTAGLVAADDLRVGDMVLTRDNGIQPIAWVGTRRLKARDLTDMPQLAPVMVRAGALGQGLPVSDMLLSPNHRILVVAPNGDEHITPVQTLVGRPGVERLPYLGGVDYLHFAFERHEIVLSNGSWSESFQPGIATLSSLDHACREELLALFPDLRFHAGIDAYAPARAELQTDDRQSRRAS